MLRRVLLDGLAPYRRWLGIVVVLQVVGNAPPPEVLALKGGGVEVTGWVEDVTPYVDAAAVVAAPLSLGGGMRIKILEALVAGKAVVATTRAAEGLHVLEGEHIVLRDEDEAFADAIAELLSNPAWRAALAIAGRTFALAHLTWSATADAYEALYDDLLAERRRRLPPPS